MNLTFQLLSLQFAMHLYHIMYNIDRPLARTGFGASWFSVSSVYAGTEVQV